MRHRPHSLVGPGQALVSLLIALPFEGSGAPADAGVLRNPRWVVAKPPGGTLCEGVPSLLSERGASRRSTAAFYRCAGRASENVDQPRLSASSWRQVVVPASGAPPSPESLGCVAPDPRRRIDRWRGFPPVIDPVSSRHISALPHRCSVFTASHVDAPRRAGRGTINTYT